MPWNTTRQAWDWNEASEKPRVRNVRRPSLPGSRKWRCLCRGQAPASTLHPSPISTPNRNKKGCSINTYSAQKTFKISVLRESTEEAGQKRVHVVCFHLYVILGNENKSINSDRKLISGFLGKEGVGRRNYKGAQRNFWQKWIWLLSWLWWWFHRSIHMSKQAKSCIFNL